MLVKQWIEHDKHGKNIICTGYFLLGFIPVFVRKAYL